MDTEIANRLIHTIYSRIDAWNKAKSTSSDLSAYDLAIVGGVAYNTVSEIQIPTKDLDLKLAYRGQVSPRNYYSMFTYTFNKLRTQLMLDFANSVNRQIDQDHSLKTHFEKHFHQFSQKDYLVVAIKYKLPYIIYDYGDTLRCCRQHREMIHMVMSLIYHQKNESDVTSLVDLSMFVNLNNPERLYQLPLNNYLFLSGQGQPISAQHISIDGTTLVPVAQIGHIIKDLLWLSLLHHKEEKRERAKKKISLLINGVSLPNVSMVSEILTYLTSVNYLAIGFSRLKTHYLTPDKFVTTTRPPVPSPDRKYPPLELIKSEPLLKQLELLDEICAGLDYWQSAQIIPTYTSGLLIKYIDTSTHTSADTLTNANTPTSTLEKKN